MTKVHDKTREISHVLYNTRNKERELELEIRGGINTGITSSLNGRYRH